MNTKKNKWREILQSELPGENAHRLMAPSFRGEFKHDTDPVRAAVLILMYPYRGHTNIVFIKRNEYDGHHSAQVSLPGGAWEEEDESLENTALRETREELGISGEIDLLGSLTELHIPISNFLVSPFVGSMAHTPIFNPDKSEVQFVIQTPLADLLNPRHRKSEILFRHEQSITAPFYLVENEKIWGATAMILSEFLQLASNLPAHHR